MLEEDKKLKVLAFNLKFSVKISKITRLNNKDVKQSLKFAILNVANREMPTTHSNIQGQFQKLENKGFNFAPRLMG